MAAPHIAGRYALYKEGTTKIVRYLTKNAALCSIAYANVHLKTTITTHDLLRYANAIANGMIDIPSTILELLVDVISGRRICADWYTAQASSVTVKKSEVAATESSNRTHRHFVEVLNEIHDLLKEARRARRAEKLHSTSGSVIPVPAETEAKESLPSLFALLEVEEPSDTPLGTAPPQSLQPAQEDATGLSTACYTLELDDREEKEFAVWCFLEDLHEIRMYLRSIWSGYVGGELSLLAASAVADVAFGIMRRAERDFTASHPELSDVDKIAGFLGYEYQTIDDIPHLVSCETSHAVDAKANAANLLCPLAAGTLFVVLGMFELYQASLKDVIAEREECEQAEEQAENQAEAAQISELATGDRDVEDIGKSLCPFHAFSAALASTSAELSVQAATSKMGMAQDEFVWGFRQVWETKEISTWLVVACQCYIDLFDATAARPNLWAVGLCKAVRETKETHTQFERFMERYQGSHNPKVIHIYKNRLERDNLVEQTLTRTSHDRRGETGNGTTPPNDVGTETWVATQIFRALPITAGQRLYNHKLTVHYVTVEMTNFGSAVLAVAHLYRAAQHYGMLESSWLDMDWLLETHSKKHLLVQDVAPGADDLALCRHYEIAMGIAPSAFASMNRGGRISIKDMAKRQDERRIKVGSNFIETLLERIRSDGIRSGPELLDGVLRSLHSVGSKSKNGHGDHNTVTGLQLLKTFKATTLADEPQLNFDYLSFWIDCADLLSKWNTNVVQMLPKRYRAVVKGGPELVLFLLHDAVDYQRAHRPLEQCAFGMAVKMLQEMIGEQGGDKFTKAAFEKSSGHIPEHMRPTFATENAIPLRGEQTSHAASENAEVSDAPAPLEDATTDEQAPDVREVFAARKKRGRRFLRTRK